MVTAAHRRDWDSPICKGFCRERQRVQTLRNGMQTSGGVAIVYHVEAQRG